MFHWSLIASVDFKEIFKKYYHVTIGRCKDLKSSNVSDSVRRFRMTPVTLLMRSPPLERRRDEEVVSARSCRISTGGSPWAEVG